MTAPAASGPVKSILVVKLSALGDVVLSTPCFRAIREANPDAHITLMIGKIAAPLVSRNPNLDERWAIDENIFWKKRPGALWTLARTLRRRDFDRVYILHWSPLFHLFFLLCGIPERIGFARGGRSLFLTRSSPYREADPATHDIDQYLQLAHAADSPSAARREPEIFFDQTENGHLDERLASLGLPKDRPWVAIAPGGGNNPKLFMPQKRWPAEYFETLKRRLIETDRAFIIIVGDSSEHELLEPAERRDQLNMAGRLTLRETALLIQRCRLFIGNDSGLLHIAGAIRTPSVSFFGPTSPHGKDPLFSPHRILYAGLPCSPCYKHGKAPTCPHSLRCLTSLTPDQALKASQELLRS